MARKRALGKGLDALLPEMDLSKPSGSPTLDVDDLSPNPEQPRKEMDPDALQELAESIKRYGVLQPIAVCLKEDGSHEIIAGERRWRGAKLAGLQRIPVHFVEDPAEKGILGLIENIQREDLSAMEIASCIVTLQEEKHLTQEEIALALGWSRSAIANKVRLLQLPPTLQEMIQEGVINEGHGRALLGLEPEEMRLLAEKIVDQDLSVRQTEVLVRQIKKAREAQEKGSAQEELSEKNILQEHPLVRSIQERFGLNLRVEQGSKGATIKVKNLGDEERDAFLEHLLKTWEELFPGK